ncbi:hypothetical protein SLS62_005190 [Diatrype stigma]|uniref:Uncharacterized protein n=1 Tax=Diatrype stigma TaxID=117547 RepID=A0AAN9US32_9PEZI
MVSLFFAEELAVGMGLDQALSLNQAYYTWEELVEQVDADAAAWGTAVPSEYLNYAFTGQDPIGSYGAENKKFCGRLARSTTRKDYFRTFREASSYSPRTASQLMA